MRINGDDKAHDIAHLESTAYVGVSRPYKRGVPSPQIGVPSTQGYQIRGTSQQGGYPPLARDLYQKWYTHEDGAQGALE